MAHELDSVMLLVHPPLAIAGHVMTYVFTWFLFCRAHRARISFVGSSAWLLTLLGLFTGMLWARSAWGSFWSWDPKETMTLALFLSLTAALAAHIEGRDGWARPLALLSCGLSALTVAASISPAGLHSFL
ncbi:MAG: cytochrome c biogenesis protein CcsA [Thermoplasmatota archaeon]